MKTTGLLAFLLSIAIRGLGQQIESSVHLNSGLFRFGGQSATRTSALALASGRAENNFTVNPYSKNFGLSYGTAAQLQKITSENLIMGLTAGYSYGIKKIPPTTREQTVEILPASFVLSDLINLIPSHLNHNTAATNIKNLNLTF